MTSSALPPDGDAGGTEPAPVALPTPEGGAVSRRIERRTAALRAGAGMMAGFSFVAVANAIGVAAAVPRPSAGIGLRVVEQLFGIAETLGVGAVATLPVVLWIAFVDVPVAVGVVAYAAAAAGIVYASLAGELYRQASCTLDGRFEMFFFVVYTALAALAFPTAHLLGTLFSRYRRLSFLPLVLVVGGVVTNEIVLRDDYFSLHATIGWVAAILFGTTIAPRAERAAASLFARRNGKIALAAMALAAALGIAIPPSNAVRVELFRDPCTFAPWVLASVLWRSPSVAEGTPKPDSTWLAKRNEAPPVPPTTPPLFATKNPIVIFATIDATRGDVVNDGANDRLFPVLSELKRTGTVFLNATSPGSQTAVSLTTTFSGRMFSELRWGYHGTGITRFHYAADDPAARFPELLTKAGVRTVSFCSVNFLANEFGVLHGFSEEHIISKGRNHAFARQMVDPVLDTLRHAGDGPLFIYFHLMEPHAPYDRGRHDGTEFERYVSEIGVADVYLSRVLKLLKQRFPDRGVLIVGADHGEAFDEHETTGHTKTLYDELLHVPLLVYFPGGSARAVNDRVALADVGPTILDLFGVNTPGDFVAQSLVPALEGRPPATEGARPILAEGRLRRALIRPDGFKVIEDRRRTTVEAYDLVRDPKELENLFGKDPRADAALLALRTFFEANAYRAPGYDAPYKP